MKENFEAAVALILGPTIEGGYSNDVNDPGGETNHGISKRAHPNEDISNMTVERAKEIYRENYWTRAGCDELPAPLDILVFDSAVNQGVSAALTMLKKTDSIKDLPERCALFMADRAQRYAISINYSRYGRGWFKRLFKIAMDSAVSF